MKMGLMGNLRKKYPEAAKITKKFLESSCCDEDREISKKKSRKKKRK